MILLILGWHLTLIGVLAIILSAIFGFGGMPCLIFGLGALAVGFVMSVVLRKTCSAYRSNLAPKTEANERPLDYY